MMLELADGERGGRGIVNRSQKLTMPCLCIEGKPAYVKLPDGKWMRYDLFNQAMNDSGYDLSGSFWSDVGGFFKKAGDTALNILGGTKSTATPPINVNIPGQSGGGDVMSMILGMMMGNKGALPGQAPVPAPTPAQYSQTPSWLIPAAVGGGILLLTLVLTKD